MIWILVLGAINLFLLLVSLKLFIPKEFQPLKNYNILYGIKKQLPFILIIIAVVIFHLIEVNFIDSITTNLINYDYAHTLQSFEDNIVINLTKLWTPVLVYFFVIMYIAVYPFTLWFAPLYFIWFNQRKSLKTLAYGLLLMYLFALPFYLFLPISNVYTYFNAESALESAIPSVENFFYTTTTQNNCLPSLHTAMTILIAYSISLTGNKRFTYFAYFTMTCVIISVIYLSIHWLTDIITGALLSIGVILILKWFMKDEIKK